VAKTAQLANRWRRIVALAALLLLPVVSGCPMSDESRLLAAKRAGEITVLTYAGSTTYYETPEGAAGFEYDLAKALADHLGLRLRVLVATRYANALSRLLAGEADFAAANITDTLEHREQVRFASSYYQIRQQVVYRLGDDRPANVEDLIGRDIEVQSGTPSAGLLYELKHSHPDLVWTETDDLGPEDLLQLVWEGLLDLTVADSNAVALNQQYFPELQVGFSFGEPQPVAWAFRKTDDASLSDAATEFLKEFRHTGSLAQLVDRYYGPASRSNFINLTVFRARVHNRLPNYQQPLEDAGEKYKIDWRLLAALAYQESYWNPNSVSYTGVSGFMMLTRETAAELGIDDRTDAAASIDGGAHYFRDLLDRLPARIALPDRLWFALAAYNTGLSHLEDARILTQEQHGDPDKWTDVRKRLPLLADPKWFTRTKYGYARGDEPVRFVSRVRAYYDVLVKMDDEERARNTTRALKLKAPAI
jgi:membrane-bound lytic murein transglycosylase F